ncbi:hypothetical protein Q5P01_007534 [Channa striata]|uniref:Uncharacterized protein n=1 Tax=Channa striata TaxID=64152 RepID=A0AA88N6P4_CHASR|nr:hypothetical protein Q5P01_007534 [Channa striata]
MDSSKGDKSTNRHIQDGNSDANDEDKHELCPGFKDVDAFVKYGLGAVYLPPKHPQACPNPEMNMISTGASQASRSSVKVKEINCCTA